MCYRKPGPRCSSYALRVYSERHQAVYEAYTAKAPKQQIDKLVKARETARKEYYLTPAGLHEIQTQIQQHPDNQELQDRYNTYKTERERRIQASRNQQVTHRRKPVPDAAGTFPTNGTIIPAATSPEQHKTITDSINESYNWGLKLTNEEIEAVRYYSGGGYLAINSTLAGHKHLYNEDDSEVTAELVKHLDSALKKHAQPNPRLVYRKQLLLTETGELNTIPREQAYAQFNPGTIYQPPVYMSATIAPEEWLRDWDSRSPDITNVSFAILTRTGVPVTAVAAHGASEGEILLPRNTKYKVVDNNIQIINKNKPVRVILLEEL